MGFALCEYDGCKTAKMREGAHLGLCIPMEGNLVKHTLLTTYNMYMGKILPYDSPTTHFYSNPLFGGGWGGGAGVEWISHLTHLYCVYMLGVGRGGGLLKKHLKQGEGGGGVFSLSGVYYLKTITS